MKSLLLSLLLVAGAYAQTPPALTFYVHDTTGQTADTPFPSIYQLNSTAQGSGSPLVLKGINTSGNTILLSIAYVSNDTSSAVLNPNFSLTGLYQSQTIAPGGSVIFTVNFVPIVTGLITGYLQVAYQVQQPNCSFTDPTIPCPSFINTVSTLTGMATAAAFVLSYPNADGSGPVVPQAGSTISFGNVATSATSSITFTLTNQSAVTVTPPAVALRVQQFGTPAFALNTTAIPTSLAPNASASFVVTFAPGQTGLVSDTYLDVGTNSYSLAGVGVVVADIDVLQIFYVNSSGIRTLPQAATPISFGQLVPGTGASSTLVFTVTNPTTSFNAVTLPSLTVTGAGFGISGAPTIPASIAPGQSITFNLTFAAASAGTFTGTLSIGSRQFLLSGQSVASPFPALSFKVTPNPLTSQQQASITLNLAAPTTINAIGALNVSFTSAVANVTDDPAVAFTTPSGRNESVTFAPGSQATPAFTFQTGTTAGTIVFTAKNFVNTTPYTQSFTIPAAAVQITSGTAARQTPNLVVTVNGYDNTYSAGQLAFAFYDISGNLIQPPIQYNASSQFHQYFFTNNQYGGAFALQATFPDTSDVTKVGSVAVTLSNSAGQTTVTETFQ
ncbi:MAG TPA: choice-of-anchor D domain-containing protein [Bryobacteraceae bacterium]|jgi:hypothetical protein